MRLGLILCFAASLVGPTRVFAQHDAPRTLAERLEALDEQRLEPGLGVSIRYHLETAQRIARRHPDAAGAWRRRAVEMVGAAEDGRDPYLERRGLISNRGYRSALSRQLQGYAVYLPQDYDPNRAWPVYVALHGGSSNGNLFLGVVMGRNLDWESYSQHLYDEFRPRWHAPMIVVAPDGFGQVMWRWMGERDVLDVLADVARVYNIDPDRVVLGGISNGGVGAYAIGTRHAWRFSVVQAMAGAPSWLQYAGGQPTGPERTAMRMLSGMHLMSNVTNTDFRYYHGRTDGGPMRPVYVEALDRLVRDGGHPARGTWYNAGHDILYRVLRHGRNFGALADIRRDPRPSSVHLVTSDYRAARQHWVKITRMLDYPAPARVDASVEGSQLTLECENVAGVEIDLRSAPLDDEEVTIAVGDLTVYEGSRRALGHAVHLRHGPNGWALGFPAEGEIRKRPGLSGPITDAYFERMVHVYGTQVADDTQTLRRAAEQGARGWPVWLWGFEQEVLADDDITEDHIRDAHLVLYGNRHNHSTLARIFGSLPIRTTEAGIQVGETLYDSPGVGARFIFPNPEHPERYVVVQTSPSAEGVLAGNQLPDFVSDWIVYDGVTTRRRSRLVTSRGRARDMGFFDVQWRLRPQREGGDPDAGTNEVSQLPVPRAPRRPALPTGYAAPADDPAGRVAREIARRVRTFYNFRAAIPGAQWTVDRESVWRVLPQAECLTRLQELGVPARLRPDQSTPVPTPVELIGPVGGVWFELLHEDRPLLISCELAARLPALAEVLRRHGVTGVEVMSAWRSHPRPSFHTLGLALDIARLWTERGWLSVRRHFHETPERRTCPAGRSRSRAGILRRIACDLAATHTFNSVLTPNYNEGHRDHFHLDVRPADPRFFVR